MNDKTGFNTGLCDIKAFFRLRLENFASQQTGSILLASLLRNISSSYLLYPRQEFSFKLNILCFPSNRLLFNQLFSPKHPQGILSTKTLGTGNEQSQDKRTKSFWNVLLEMEGMDIVFVCNTNEPWKCEFRSILHYPSKQSLRTQVSVLA